MGTQDKEIDIFQRQLPEAFLDIEIQRAKSSGYQMKKLYHIIGQTP